MTWILAYVYPGLLYCYLTYISQALNDSPSRYDIVAGIVKIVERSKVLTNPISLSMLTQGQKPDPNSYHEMFMENIMAVVHAGCTPMEYDQLAYSINDFLK